MGQEIASLGRTMIDLDLAKRASDLGSPKFSSMIVAGFIAGIFMLGEDSADTLIEKRFKDPDLSDKNKKAFRVGYGLGVDHVGGTPVLQVPDKPDNDEVFLDATALLHSEPPRDVIILPLTHVARYRVFTFLQRTPSFSLR